MRISLLLAVLVVLPACSGLRPVETTSDVPETAVPAYPSYETFDATGYDAQPQVQVEVEHDVPRRVMEGRVMVPGASGAEGPAPTPPPSEPVATQVEGYRIQVFTSVNRDTAEGVRGEAVRWWQQSSSSRPDAIVAYQQPYYKVQVGAFADRDDADRALAAVRAQYPEAFIVPSVVTVMR